VADPILVVHFLESVEGAAELRSHDLDVLGDVAVLTSVRVLWFEDDNVTPIHAPSAFLAKRCERALLPQLSPMALAVAKRVVRLLAAGKVTVGLGLEDGSKGPAGIVLRGVPDTPTAIEPRPPTPLEATDPRGMT
jgi:hypothetical protein